MPYFLEIMRRPSGNYYYFKHNWREGTRIRTERIALGPEKQALPILSDLQTKQPQNERVLSYSGEVILLDVARRLRFPQVISDIVYRDTGLDCGTFMAYLTIERLLNPVSKWCLARKVHGRSFFSLDPAIPSEQFTDDNIYNYMDYVEPNIHRIQNALIMAMQDEFGVGIEELILDSTSTYFYVEDPVEDADDDTAEEKGSVDEGDDLEILSGYSRDGRFDLRQINVLVATTKGYVPLFFEAFSGNTHDTEMFRRSLTLLRKRYRRVLKKVKTTYFVFDSGNNNDGNVERMDDLCAKHRSWWFVTGLKKATVKSEILTTPDDEFELLYSYKDTRLLGKTIEKELYGKKRKVLLYFNKKKKERATRIFKLRIKKANAGLAEIVEADLPLDAKLERIHAFLKTMRMVTLFKINTDKDGCVGYEIDAKERSDRLALFGKFAVFTNNLDLPAEKILSVFKSKNVVEHGFHLFKGLLLIRPVNHRLPRRIRAHLAIVVWGMTFLALLRNQLHENGIEYSFEDLVDVIGRGKLRIGDYAYPELKRTYRTRTLIDVNEPLTSTLRTLKIPTDYFDIELLPTE